MPCLLTFDQVPCRPARNECRRTLDGAARYIQLEGQIMGQPEDPKQENPSSTKLVIQLPDGDLVIRNEDPGARHPYRRIYRDDPLHAELLPLARPGYIPPFAYADMVFLGRPDDQSEAGLREFAQKAAATIANRVKEGQERYGPPGEEEQGVPRSGASPDGQSAGP